MKFIYKSLTVIFDNSLQKGIIYIILFLIIGVSIGLFSTIEESSVDTISTFISLFSGILFTFSFVLVDSSKRKNEELNKILKESGTTLQLFLDSNQLPENENYHISDIHNRLRFIQFSEKVITLILTLVFITIIIFSIGISLGITLNIDLLISYQTTFHTLGIITYTIFTLFYLYIVLFLVFKVYNFFMNELSIK
jgi:hypothetical protein